jgi:NAD(P)-dependent dehydrogenase (short-subunit alcohol dehydrogenase family)
MKDIIGLDVGRDSPPVAVVTGSAGELGRATAVQLAAGGYQLVLVDRDERSMVETARRVEARGGKTRAFCTDIADARSVGDMVRQVANEISSPSLLVNIAFGGIGGSVLETSDAEWSKALAANLTGPFLVTRAIVPLMIDRGGGVIINVTSAVACVGARGRAAHCASAAGLVGLSRAVAFDHASDGVRCVAICEGDVGKVGCAEVLANRSWAARADRSLSGGSSSRSLASTDDVAAIIGFVAGPAGRAFNGRAVLLDGATLVGEETPSYAHTSSIAEYSFPYGPVWGQR